MKLIIGLGNPGDKYANNRHNVGYMVVDYFAESKNLTWKSKTKQNAWIAEGDGYILAKPNTYMNNSGLAAAALKQFYKPDEILVIADDIDREFASIRTRLSGGHGGNNGLGSVISAIGEDFARLRVGAKNQYRDKTDAADFVLSDFSKDEVKLLPEIIGLSSNQIDKFINGEFVESTYGIA